MASEELTLIVARARAVMEQQTTNVDQPVAPAPAARKPRILRAHPSYEEMIRDAIVTLKDRTGSSQYAIAKFIEGKHKQLPLNFRKLLGNQLKRLVASCKLVKVKASFKLPPLQPMAPKPLFAVPGAKKRMPVDAKPRVNPEPKPEPVRKRPPMVRTPQEAARANALAQAQAWAKVAQVHAKARAEGRAKAYLARKLKAAEAEANPPMPKPKPASRPAPKERHAPTKASSPWKKAPAAKSGTKKAVTAKKAPAKSVKSWAKKGRK